jgi:hypothetical protein
MRISDFFFYSSTQQKTDTTLWHVINLFCHFSFSFSSQRSDDSHLRMMIWKKFFFFCEFSCCCWVEMCRWRVYRLTLHDIIHIIKVRKDVMEEVNRKLSQDMMENCLVIKISHIRICASFWMYIKVFLYNMQ